MRCALCVASDRGRRRTRGCPKFGQEKLKYSDLHLSGDDGFEQFGDKAVSKADDAQLVAVWNAFRLEHHTPGAYKTALGAKLDRFKKSGAADIGRQRKMDRTFHAAQVYRDTRVVWVEHDDGSKTLSYQSQEGDYNPTYIRRGDPGSEGIFGKADQPLSFGARNPRERVRNEGRVPSEFAEIVLERSERIWGPTPTIPDPITAHLRAAKGKPTNPFVPQHVPKATPAAQDTPAKKVVEPNWDALPDAFKTKKL